MHRKLVPWLSICGITAATVFAVPVKVHADEVLAWNAVALRAIGVAAVPGPLQGRALAIVHVAMFDALNGIERRYTPIQVDAAAPRGASRRAAVVQAAYTALVAQFPAQASQLAADLETSLAGIAPAAAIEHSESIRRGREWGEYVANAIIAWRNADGLNPPAPPYLGSLTVGKWRPTPPGNLPGLAPTLAMTQPFVIPTPSSFRPVGPPPLTSAEYAESVNEIKSVGELRQRHTHRGSDAKRSFLGGHGRLLLEPGRRRCRRRATHLVVAERQAVRAAERRRGRCTDRVLGFEILLRALAADYRDSAREH